MLNTLGKEANPPFSVPFSLVNVFPLCREWGQKSLPMYKMNRCDPVMLVYEIGMSHLFFFKQLKLYQQKTNGCIKQLQSVCFEFYFRNGNVLYAGLLLSGIRRRQKYQPCLQSRQRWNELGVKTEEIFFPLNNKYLFTNSSNQS